MRNEVLTKTRGARRMALRPSVAYAAMLCAAALSLDDANAFEVPTGNSDLKLRWDTTVKYSNAFRVKPVDPALVGPAQANLDDGDRNFSQRGMVSNRLDLFSEADLIYQENIGARVSAAAWYDTIYNRGNHNDSPATVNSQSVPAGQFTHATRDLMGQKAEVLDAFVFGRAQLGDMSGSLRLGRHAQLWGETLFFGGNGIAGGMAPIDMIKLLSVPSSQFKEIIRPVNQVSGQLQVSSDLSIGAYYQLEWEPNRIPASGSYGSFSDVFGDGSERLFWATGSQFAHGPDVKARNSGQYGAQLRYRPSVVDAEFGLYAIRYHQKDFSLYLRPNAGPAFFGGQGTFGDQVGNYGLAYHEGIRAYGASVSTAVGDANVAVEGSMRENTPLVNGGVFALAPNADNQSNPAYPVGRSAHLNASMVLLLSPSVLWDGGSLLAEVGWNRLLSVTSNPQAVDPNATRDAWGFRLLATPTYFQVLPGLDLSVPIGLGFNPKGRSSVVTLFNGGVDKGGDYSIGVSGEYLKKYKFAITYTGYIGARGAVLANSNDRYSFRQYYKDRDFISASIQASF